MNSEFEVAGSVGSEGCSGGSVGCSGDTKESRGDFAAPAIQDAIQGGPNEDLVD